MPTVDQQSVGYAMVDDSLDDTDGSPWLSGDVVGFCSDSSLSPTRNKVLPTDTTGVAYVDKLIEGLLHTEELFTPAPSPFGYRNKVSYNLFDFKICPIAIPEANAIASTISEWVQFHSAQPKLFWKEVSVKVTRSGNAMIRLTFCGYDMNAWIANESHLFLDFISKQQPCIKSIYYQHGVSQAKPTKTDEYHLLAGDPHVFEATPNGLEFLVSPDTFTEINHYMEDKVFDKMFEWTAPYQGGELLTLGRDINALVLSFNQQGQFSKTYSFTHCPLVHKDAVTNFEKYKHMNICHQRRDKDDIGNAILELETESPLAVALTSGRHGLKDSLIQSFKAKRNVVQVIYNSCNPVSLKKDALKFLSGPNSFMIVDFHSFDFFPGTKYISSITRLVRRPRTLILPVGPAGVGKSFLARQLNLTLPQGSFYAFERDAVFAALRNSGFGLKATSQKTHQALQDALSQCPTDVLYVDSTNGNREARQLYQQLFKPDLLVHVVFEVPLDVHDAALALTQRTMQRVDHPSFPEGETEQQVKHEKILQGIEWPDPQQDPEALILQCNALDDASKQGLAWELFQRIYAPIGLQWLKM